SSDSVVFPVFKRVSYLCLPSGRWVVLFLRAASRMSPHPALRATLPEDGEGDQRPEPTVPGWPERSASLVFTGSMVGLSTSPTPGMSRTLSVSRLIAGIAGAMTPATTLR